MLLYRPRVLLALIAASLIGPLCRAGTTDESEIVKLATKALRADWAADPSYACEEKDEVQKGDKLSSKTFEVVMIDGSDYRLPLAVDDQALPPARHKAELIKLKSEIDRRASESPSARRSRIDAWKKQRDENGELLLDFPTALTFQLRGEETKDGHAAYVFSGTPGRGRQGAKHCRLLPGKKTSAMSWKRRAVVRCCTGSSGTIS